MHVEERVLRHNTLVFVVPECLRNGTKEEFLSKLVSVLRGHALAAVQFMPGYYVRVTFDEFESRQAVFRDGLCIDYVSVPLIEAEQSVRFVYLHHCPVEVPDPVINAVFSDFGAVLDILPVRHPGSDILTGSRIVKMSLQEPIPSKLRVLRFPCRVWYRGQPVSCYICDQSDHVAAACPLRGLCRSCRQPGHLARDCPGVSESPPAHMPTPDDPAPDAAPVDTLSSVRRAAKRSSSAVVDVVSDSCPVAKSAAVAADPVVESVPAESVSAESVTADPVPESAVDPAVSVEPADPAVPASVVAPLESADAVAVDLAVADSSESPDDVAAKPSASAPAVPSGYSSDAVFVDDGVIDLGRLTRRCVTGDSATPDMYREVFYSDEKFRGVLPVYSVFPPGRPPLPNDGVLDPGVAPASFCFFPRCAAPVLPMEVVVLARSSRPRWIEKIPGFPKSRFSYSKDAHLTYEVWNDSGESFPGIFDFSYLTYRVVTDQLTFEEDRARCTRPRDPSKIPPFGVVAVDLPSLSSDVVPAFFPCGRSY